MSVSMMAAVGRSIKFPAWIMCLKSGSAHAPDAALPGKIVPPRRRRPVDHVILGVFIVDRLRRPRASRIVRCHLHQPRLRPFHQIVRVPRSRSTCSCMRGAVPVLVEIDRKVRGQDMGKLATIMRAQQYGSRTPSRQAPIHQHRLAAGRSRPSECHRRKAQNKSARSWASARP